ncbi:hypothetical protein AA12717_0319 [Gluconacetobacter sacchari DSM 12717]|uniref:Uncharacterized protein n=2 Tax=Gluconacetobacter sacchari TaxID=92759 RepID=A0A7W4IDE4_9PROT|nr:hypothetical protein [Gluconacetobacter sacchari]MBB2160684.1 hypothetical protein [Gluconacetobacter sacchari]GBQ19657.1 hypothetical protein AA12717_0319 [Gluconacetobacter sacchari DSM 12717]
MTTLNDQIQMLRAELTSFHLSRRERAKIERELARALAAAALHPGRDE